MDLLLNGTGDLVIRDVEKAEEFHAFFTLVFASKTCLQEVQVPETSGTVWSREDFLSVEEEDQVWECLQKLDVHKSVGSDGMHP